MERISRDYAVALFTVAKENNREEVVYNDLKKVEAVFAEIPEYLDLLSAPSIPLKKRLEAADEAFGKAVGDEVRSFIEILCKNSKIRTFPDCFSEFEDLFVRYENRNCRSLFRGSSFGRPETEALQQIKEDYEKDCRARL